VWISPGLPGSTHDLTGARIHRIITAADRVGVELLADKGVTGRRRYGDQAVQGRNLTKVQNAHNQVVNSLRGPGERGFATLKAWRIFTEVHCCPHE
jgi:hypothetical protein